MPFNVVCPSCGKALSVRDEWAGKKLKCPQCAQTFPAIQSAGATPTVAPAVSSTGVAIGQLPPAAERVASRKYRDAPVKRDKGDKVYVSKGLIIGIIAAVLVVGGIILFIAGPVRTWKAWEAMGSKPDDDVRGVVDLGLKCWASAEHRYNPRKSSGPEVKEDVLFVRPVLAMGLPDAIEFKGYSSEGNFVGHYNPHTGEVDAECEVGGMSIAGVGGVGKSQGKIRITGRIKDGGTTVEVDGKPAQIVYPPKYVDEE